METNHDKPGDCSACPRCEMRRKLAGGMEDGGPDKVEWLADELYGTTLTSGTDKLQTIAVELWDIAAAARRT